MTETSRVLVVGGGLVGLAFAIALATENPRRLKVELLEARTPPKGNPDPMDSRASALSEHSRRLLEKCGAWAGLKEFAAPIRQVHVSNQRRFGSTLLRSTDVDSEALGFVAENHHIGRALLDRAEQLGIRLRAPASIVALDTQQVRPSLHLADGRWEQADLVVLADGGNSSLREALGIDADTLDSEQVAVVANVSFRGKQAGTAFERFTACGPLALLPLVDAKPGEQRFNLVWSMSNEDAARRLEAEAVDFLHDLQAAFGWRLGRAMVVGKRTAWPLARTCAREQSRPGFLVAGNAAHALHPVAGQGLNLSLRDADVFAQSVASGFVRGASPGSRRVLRAYEHAVSTNQAAVIGATDTLATLFNRRGPLLDLPRDAALAAMDMNPLIRRGVAMLGTGGLGGV